MSTQKFQFGLIGKKLNHSFSKKYFEEKFLAQSINHSYQNFELENINEIQTIFKIGNLRGLNVTIPYKEVVIPFLDELSEEAKIIGAVNCIQFKGTKKIGFNTDAFGFEQMIKPFFETQHDKALIFGTGGASKAVKYVLEKLGVKVFQVSRTKSENVFTYHEVSSTMMRACKLLVNTTPLGMFPQVDEALEIPYQAIDEKHLVIDLIYNPKQTLFLKKAKEQGATILNGETMLYQQAEKSWKIWNAD